MSNVVRRRSRGPAGVLAGIVAAAIVAAACGGGGGGSRLSKGEYQTKVKSIGDQFAATLEQVFSDPKLRNPSSLKEAADVIRHGADIIRQASSDLDAVSPPTEVEAPHDQLIQGLGAFADDLDEFAQDAEDGNLDAINAFNEAVNAESLDSMKTILAAIDAFKAAGYDIGPRA